MTWADEVLAGLPDMEGGDGEPAVDGRGVLEALYQMEKLGLISCEQSC